MGIRKKILNLTSPILIPIAKWYLSKHRSYRFQNIKIEIFPGVFHPALFFSTKILIRYAAEQRLKGFNVLELGAGSGLLSLCCAKQGAIVTASDINPLCISNLEHNSKINAIPITIIQSDLFERVSPVDFDFIFINPPFYPKNPKHINEQAWFCGENFEYFKNLFYQLDLKSKNSNVEVIMVLSEDCQVEKIIALAKANELKVERIKSEKIFGEVNYVFRVLNINGVSST